jgi:uncharacterized protein (TIGR02145 family)
MKKIYAFIVAVSFTASMFAQAPQKMSYQAVIRNSSNQLVVNHIVGMQISILQNSSTGTPVYVETQIPTTNANGLISIEIGGGTNVTGTFIGIDWSAGMYFIKTETDPSGGTNYTITGVSQLLSVPYALYARTAENGFSGNYGDLTNKPTLFDGIYSSLTGIPILATIASTGSFNDLINKPSLKDTVIMYGFNGNYNNLINKPVILDSISKYSVLLTGNQTVAGNKTFTGKITGSFNANNTAVSNVATPVNANDAVNKAYVTLRVSVTGDTLYLGNGQHVIITGISAANPPSPVTDFDGNVYHSLVIGTQVWMKENLRTTHYRDGSSIPNVSDGTAWSVLTGGAYCWYNNDSATYKNIYGAMYNFYTVIDSRQLCPSGWHVPSDLEWYTMEHYLDTTINNPNDSLEIGTDIGLKIKSTSGWNNGLNGTNSSGLTIVASGYHVWTGGFANIGSTGYYWTSTSQSAPYAFGRYPVDLGKLWRTQFDKGDGFSVRCIKD